jgi:hypothetical protein
VKKVEFLPKFKGKINGEFYEGHGVCVNTITGLVEVKTTPPPPPRLRNFVIFAVVTLKPTDPSDPTTEKVFEVTIRVHIHNSIKKLWLTPSSLTIHSGVKWDDGISLTVLAEFNEDAESDEAGTIGDITNWTSLRWDQHPRNAKIEVDRGGRLKATRSGEQVEITVEYGPRPVPEHMASAAEVRSLPEWSTYARSIDVKGYLGSGRSLKDIKQATNLLFLPEGFRNNEKEKGIFYKIVQGIERRLRDYRTVRPLSYELKDSINIWAAFVPSKAGAINVLSELVTYSKQGKRMKGDVISKLIPKRPANDATKWTLANLIYEVGLPVPKDDTPSMDLTKKVDHWNELFGTDSNGNEFKEALVQYPEAEGRPGVYDRWCRCATRVLLNENDTAFGLYQGARPTAKATYSSPKELGLNPCRMTSQHLEQFVENLNYKNDRIGSVWTKGKYKDPVCFIVRTDTANAMHGGNVLNCSYVPLRTGGKYRLKEVTNGFDLRTVSLPKFPKKEEVRPTRLMLHSTTLTVVHEMGHALGLDDEYGDLDRPPTDRELEIAKKIKNAGNIQAEIKLRSGDPGTNLDPKKVREELKWLWPRIKNAGVLDKGPEPSGGVFSTNKVFTIRLKQGHGRFFKKNEIVFLRRRPLTEDSGHNPAFLVVETNSTSDDLQVEVVLGTEYDPEIAAPNSYGEGSVLLTPVFPPGRLLDPLDFYPLVAPLISEHMATTKRPLDAPSDDPNILCCPEEMKKHYARKDYMKPKSLPPSFFTRIPKYVSKKLKKQPYYIVGLYSGGYSYYCGVLHPTGICLMNQDTKHHRGVHRFCHVCRYLIVDRIDPTKHWKIDKMYKSEYPVLKTP